MNIIYLQLLAVLTLISQSIGQEQIELTSQPIG